MTETTTTGRFEWLRAKRHRRTALLQVHNALRRGWILDGDRRAALVWSTLAANESARKLLPVLDPRPVAVDPGAVDAAHPGPAPGFARLRRPSGGGGREFLGRVLYRF